MGQTGLSAAALRRDLAMLARTTWELVGYSFQVRMSVGETSLTDINLIELRRRHPKLLVYKHPPGEEVRTGADWEWWIGGADEWTCLVVQAKKLSKNRRYEGLCKIQPNGVLQVDTLIRSCWRRSKLLGGTIWPLYCFYNSWAGGWPVGVPDPIFEARRVLQDELPAYGCAVVSAQIVREVVRSERGGRTTLRSFLPLMRPWSTLFEVTGPSDLLDVSGLVFRQEQWVKQLANFDSERPSVLVSGDVGRTGKSEIDRKRPRPMSSPPDYVLDIMHGEPRPRRLKALARRVAILPLD